MGKKFRIKKLMNREVEIPDGYYVVGPDHKIKKGDLMYFNGKGFKDAYGNYYADTAEIYFCVISPADEYNPPHGYELVSQNYTGLIEKGWLIWEGNRDVRGGWRKSFYVGTARQRFRDLSYARPIKEEKKEEKTILPPEGYELVPNNSEETIKRDWKVWNKKYDKCWVETYDDGRKHSKKSEFLVYAKPIVVKTNLTEKEEKKDELSQMQKEILGIGDKKVKKEEVKMDERLKLKKQMYSFHDSWNRKSTEVEIPFGYYIVPKDQGEKVKKGDLLFSRCTKDFTIEGESNEGNSVSWKICVIRPCDKDNPPYGYELANKNELIQVGWLYWNGKEWRLTGDGRNNKRHTPGSVMITYCKPEEDKKPEVISHIPKAIPTGYELVSRHSHFIIHADWKYYDYNTKQWTEVTYLPRIPVGRARSALALVKYMIKPIVKPVKKKTFKTAELSDRIHGVPENMPENMPINKVLEYDMVKRSRYNELMNLEEDHKNLANEYVELLAKYENLEENYDDKIVEMDFLQDEFDDLKSDKDYIQEQYDELEEAADELEELKNEHELLMEERDDLLVDRDELEEKNEELETLYHDTTKAFDEYKVKAQKKIKELEDIADKHYKDSMLNKVKAKELDKYVKWYNGALKNVGKLMKEAKDKDKRNKALVDTVKSLVKKYSKYARIYKGLCIISDDSGIDGHCDEDYAFISPYKPEIHGSLNGDQEELLEMLGFKSEGDDMYMYDLRSDEEKKKDVPPMVPPVPQPLDMNCPHCEIELLPGVENETMTCAGCGEDVGWSDEYGYLLVIDPIEEDLDL